MNTLHVAMTGLSGVIGRVFLSTDTRAFRITDLFHREPSKAVSANACLDLSDPESIGPVLSKVRPDYIVHMAAITHIDACEMDAPQGKNGMVWRVNVRSTEAIAQYCKTAGIPLLYLSTECVFDGSKNRYAEDAVKHPINWYGRTKSAAEDAIAASGCAHAIIRAVVTYYKEDQGKTIYGRIRNPLRYNGTVSAVTDQRFTPTYTPDIAHAMKRVITGGNTGIFHVVPRRAISPYDFAKIVAKANGMDPSRVRKTTLVDLYGEQAAALRLKHACLDGRKTERTLGILPKMPAGALT